MSIDTNSNETMAGPAGAPRGTAAPVRVLLCLVLVAVAAGATMAIQPWIQDARFVLFYAAVALSGVVAGMTGVVLSTALALVLAELLFQPAPFDPGAVPVVRTLLFIAVAGGTGTLTHWLKRSLEESQRARARVGWLMERADEARRATVRAERLQRFTGQLLERVGEAAIAASIVEEGREAVEAAGAVLALPRDDGSLEVVAARGYPKELQGRPLPVDAATGPLAAALHTGDAIWLETREAVIARYPALDPLLLPPEYNAAVALPLRARQRHTGALLFVFTEPGPFSKDDRSFLELLAQQCAQALERTRLNHLEVSARVRAEFAERRLTFLSDASGWLAASLDYAATLSNLARGVVPELADWCIIHLLDEHGRARVAAAVHAEQRSVDLYRRLDERYPCAHDRPCARVLATGQPVYLPVVAEEHVRAAARDDEHYELLRSFGIRSQLSVPLIAEQQTLGVLTLATAESGRIFTDSDLTLALELGRRAGQAVENARLYHAAHHASETKSDFLAVMSHELRTPLNAIIGYSDLLLLGVPDGVSERAYRQVERIRSASTSLLHLVEEVLSFSRIEAGKEDIRISPVDVAAVARDCLVMIEPLAEEKSLRTCLVGADAPVKVVSDERKVRQILTNLLSNAVKFTEEGTITVSVERDATEVRIAVSDTGIGIAAEHFERIFEPFWQAEQTATRRFGGTGLGLGVARKLARLLEGRLAVESEVGRGSTFTLGLPLHTPGTQRPS
jgi:signal transduction histidine kinase